MDHGPAVTRMKIAPLHTRQPTLWGRVGKTITSLTRGKSEPETHGKLPKMKLYPNPNIQ